MITKIERLSNNGTVTLVAYVLLIIIIFVIIQFYIVFLSKQAEKLGREARDFINKKKGKRERI